MARLSLFVDIGVRSAVARQQLKNYKIEFDEYNVEANQGAIDFLNSQNRPIRHFPMPQYYVGEVLAWENGYKDVAALTAEEINHRVEEINANNSQI